MKKLNVVVYTMKGCPHCDDFKKMLDEENIEYIDRDIHDNDEEYQLFSEITENEYIPALFLIKEDDQTDTYETYMYAPERDYNELSEAKNIIKEHIDNI